MNNKTLPYGLRPHEIGCLILAAAAFYFTDEKFRGTPWPIPLFGAALAGGVAVLAGRCREEWYALPNKFFFFALAADADDLFVEINVLHAEAAKLADAQAARIYGL